MHTQLRAIQNTKDTSTLLEMAIRFIDLTQYYNEAESEVEQETIEDELEILLGKIARKFDSAVFALRNLEAQEQSFKDLANSIMNKGRAAENAKYRLKQYLIKIGSINPGMLKGQIFKGSLYTKNSVEEVDLDNLPDHYKVQKVEIKPDRKLILKDTESGITVPGVTITEKIHLRIR